MNFLAMEEVIFPALDDEYEPGDDLKPSKYEIDRLIAKKAQQLMQQVIFIINCLFAWS